jgi:5-(carboxyamino)imidazole ribonucleotide synthase
LIPPEPVKQLTLLGGGQLALMLAEAASKLIGGPNPLQLCVVGADPSDPCSRLFSMRPDLGSFVCDHANTDTWVGPAHGVLSFENEFIDLRRLRALLPAEVLPLPSLHSMATLQDKWFQKLLFRHWGIPTPDFGDTLESAPNSYVLKWRRGGYDGHGVLLDTADAARRAEFLGRTQHGFYWEQKLSLEREFAIQGAFVRGRGFCYPLVEVRSKNGVCFELSSVSQEHPYQALARQALEKIAGGLSYTGVLAMEFFESGSQIWANELAPRVHNTGHHTLKSCGLSQFEAHLRAVLGMELVQPQCAAHFGMINWLGANHRTLPIEAESRQKSLAPLMDGADSVDFKDYLKTEIRPGRKMGHWTWTASTQEESQVVRNRILNRLSDWEARNS